MTLSTAPNAAIPLISRKRTQDGKPRTLYVRRQLENAMDLVRWARAAGFKQTLNASDMHVTLAFSKEPFDWSDHKPMGGFITNRSREREVKPLGDKGAVVLRFKDEDLDDRWQHFRDAGASWDFPGFQPHVTITYQGGDVDLSKVKPYIGPLEFGPEVFEEVDDGWADKVKHTGDMARDESVKMPDIDGRLHVTGANICMESVSPYRGSEIPNAHALGLKADEIYQVYRPASELMKPETVASANGIPLMRRHVATSADDHKYYDTVGATGTSAEWQAPYIVNDLAVWPSEDIAGIETKKKTQLSPGYRYTAVREDGSFGGQKYQVRMTNILFNHVAIVTTGRQGPDVAIDSAVELQWAAIEAALVGWGA